MFFAADNGAEAYTKSECVVAVGIFNPVSTSQIQLEYTYRKTHLGIFPGDPDPVQVSGRLSAHSQ